MSIEIGPTLRRRREWARLTQQELVDHTRLERSSSYISALETGRTSPTLEELEKLARYFRLGVIEFLEECAGNTQRRTGTGEEGPQKDDRLDRIYGALTEDDQELALEFMELLAKRKNRR